jgi:predicted GIY-YIG superfamily endonuclease
MQQRLWPDAQPLVERLGREFFRRVPESPGVYLMRGVAESVLYVGKAKNLRHRLGSYRVANPERMARRTLRLLNLVEQIGWEECQSEDAALRRESELLLALKPRFNRAGVWQGPRRFVAWRIVANGLELAVMDAAMEGWTCAGPFGAQAFHLHRALVRLLWCRLHPEAGLAGMPAGWVHGEHGSQVLLSHHDASLAEEAFERLTRLTQPGGSSFQEWLLPVMAPFEQSLRDEDMELVTKHLPARGTV